MDDGAGKDVDSVGEDQGKRPGDFSVLLEQMDTLTTENTRLPYASRVNSGQSIRPLTVESITSLFRRVLRYFRRKLDRDAVLLGIKRLELPLGVEDITSGIRKDDLRTPLASGAFAHVYKCHWCHNRTSDLVAVKVLHSPSDQNSRGKMLKRLEHEIKIWVILKHDNILPFLGFCSEIKTGGLGGMVSPWLAQGCLHSYIKHNSSLTILRRLNILCDVISGLAHLHSHNVIHGDLTSMNILIKDDNSACLSDFGLSVINADVYGLSFLLSRLGGAVHWAAPEIFSANGDDEDEGQPQLSVHSDIYSFGCIMFEVFTGKLSWGETKQVTVIAKLMKKQKPRRPPIEEAPLLTDQIWNFIYDRCWATDPEERPRTAEAEKFVNDLYDQYLRSAYYEPLHEL